MQTLPPNSSQQLAPDSLTALANQLSDRIWFTRLARIYSEKRLLRNELHSQLLLLVYSIYSIALSVLLLKYKPIADDAGAVLGIILSVVLFGLSFHLTARNFPGRAQRFKQNYTMLQSLLGRLELAKCSLDPSVLHGVLEQVQKEYESAILASDNHATIDDLCSRFLAAGLKTRKPNWWDKTRVISYTISRYFLLLVIYTSPAVVFTYLLCAAK